ncbi:MAG: hypothetical protein ACRDF4_11355 [Rhabdochlamydiaceae bacterium]
MAVSKTEMQMVEDTLNSMVIELLKLKAVLIPTVKVSKKKLNKLKRIEADMLKGNKISARDLIKEMD